MSDDFNSLEGQETKFFNNVNKKVRNQDESKLDKVSEITDKRKDMKRNHRLWMKIKIRNMLVKMKKFKINVRGEEIYEDEKQKTWRHFSVKALREEMICCEDQCL